MDSALNEDRAVFRSIDHHGEAPSQFLGDHSSIRGNNARLDSIDGRTRDVELGPAGEVPHWPTYLGLGLVACLVVPLTAVSGLIAAGGFIALRRDSLETKGEPYAQSSPREATSSFPIAALRVVLGRRRFGFCPGDFVEIRPLDEILQTLGGNGTLDGVPFMPEMGAYVAHARACLGGSTN